MISFKTFLRESTDTFEIKNIHWFTGRRSKEFDKLVLAPFQKSVAKTMRDLKGRWSNGVFVFKTKEQYELAKAAMSKFEKDFAELLDAYPEDEVHLDSEIAAEYFKKLKLFDPTKQ